MTSTRTTARTAGRTAGVVALTTVCLLASGCGLPRTGTERIDAEQVPYRLLEPREPAGAGTGSSSEPSGGEPLVFWVDGDDRLVAASTSVSCAGSPAAQVERLLAVLAAGPGDQQRAEGRSSAWAPQPRLELVELAEGTAVVEVDPGARTSADRLPLATGQVSLTVTSARGVDAVRFVAQGEDLPVPLPGGALTEGPVTADEYADLLGGPPEAQQEWTGCL